MANSDPIAITVRMATSKAPPITNFRRGEEIIPQPAQSSAARLQWDYSDTSINGFLIEHSIEGGPWAQAATPAKDKREYVVGGYAQGATVKFRITAVKP